LKTVNIVGIRNKESCFNTIQTVFDNNQKGKKSMKLATVTASYIALSFGSFFGHITDREIEHCNGKRNLLAKNEAVYVRGTPGF